MKYRHTIQIGHYNTENWNTDFNKIWSHNFHIQFKVLGSYYKNCKHCYEYRKGNMICLLLLATWSFLLECWSDVSSWVYRRVDEHRNTFRLQAQTRFLFKFLSSNSLSRWVSRYDASQIFCHINEMLYDVMNTLPLLWQWKSKYFLHIYNQLLTKLQQHCKGFIYSETYRLTHLVSVFSPDCTEMERKHNQVFHWSHFIQMKAHC
jgi:hypothetical protein